MGDVAAVPLHLAVHIGGLAAAFAIAGVAARRHREAGPSWLALGVGALLLGASHVALGLLLGNGLAWPLYVRAAGYATLAYGIAGQRATTGAMPAIAVAGPMASHVVAAVSGGLAALASLGGILGRGRRVALLSSGLGVWALGDLVAATRPGVGSAVSLVGSLAILTWAYQSSRDSLALRFVSTFGAVLLVVVIALASSAAFVFGRDVRGDRIDLLETQVVGRADGISGDLAGELAVGLQVLADGQSLVNGLAAGSVTDATAQQVARIITGADVVALVDARGRVVGSYDRVGDAPLGPAEAVLAGADPVVEALEGRSAPSGLVRLDLFATESEASDLLALAVQPLFPTVDGEERRDQLAGAVVAAIRVTRADRVSEIATLTGAEVVVLSGSQVAATTIAPGSDLEADLGDLAGVDEGSVVELGGRDQFVAVAPLRGIDGQQVGTLALLEDASVVADLEDLVVRVLFLAALLGGLLATVLAGVATARATRPIRRLTEAAGAIADGDLGTRVDLGGEDEVGRLASSFDAMVENVQARDRDLRESAQREVALRARLESVTSSMDEALLAVDADGAVMMVNPAAAELLARPHDELMGTRLGDVLDGLTEDGEDLAGALGSVGDTDVRAVRGRVRDDRGRSVAVAVTAAPLVGEAGERGRVLVLRDVTIEADMTRLKDEFVSNAAHELRTPLTPVIGYADLLLRHPEMAEAQRTELLGEVARASQRLRGIVDKLVNFADLEAGRALVDPAPVDVSDLVDDVLARWRRRHPERTFRRRLARDLPPARIDAHWTERVLEELLDNAVKFSEDTVVVTGSLEEDGRVRLEIRDRGVGIPDDVIDQVTADFHQVDGSATRHYGGLGLGLAIVERILDRQDGELRITSDVGQGTHVALLLPAAR